LRIIFAQNVKINQALADEQSLKFSI